MVVEIEGIQRLLRQAAVALARAQRFCPGEETGLGNDGEKLALAIRDCQEVLAVSLRVGDLILAATGHRLPAGPRAILAELVRDGVISTDTAEKFHWVLDTDDCSERRQATETHHPEGYHLFLARIQSAFAAFRQEIETYLINADFPV